MESLMANCAALISAQAPLMAAFLVAGVLGGLTHCTVQCGVFVLGAAGHGASGPILTRLKGAAMLPYHAGRVLTYMLMAVLVALTGSLVADLLGGSRVVGMLVLLAALAFAYVGLRQWQAGHHAPRIKGLRFLSDKARIFGQFPLGMVMGFMPCAMSGTAILAAGATGDPVSAAVSMAAFGAGTALALMPVAALARVWGGSVMRTPRLAAAAPFLSACLLLALAGRLIIEGV